MLCVVPIVHLANEIVRAGTRQGTAASAQPRHPKPACDDRRRRRRRRRDQARPPASSPHHEQPNDRPCKRDLVRKAATKLRSLFRRSHGSSVVSTAPSSSCASTVDTVNLPTLFTHPPSSVPQPKTPLALSLTDIYYGPVLGRGALGTVRLATVTPEDDAVASRTEDAPRFALKILNKEVVYAKRAVANVLAEKEALNTIPSHPAIMQLHGSFNDAHNLYLLTEFLPGGELLAAMCDGLMCLRQAQFHTACIVLGLQHIHAHQFVYRDLKPENLVFGHDGYLKFVDFGLAKKLPDIHTPSGRQQARTMTRCGTPNYMAPEVFAGSGYNRAADLWSLGILLYEMFVGRTPFAATDDDGYEEEDVGFRKLRANLVRKAATNHRMRFPQRVHDRFPEACDLVDRLLQADPERRIGMRDARELRQHSFFYGLDWDALRDKRLKSPHIAAPLHNDVDSERDDRGQADQDGKSVYVSEFVRIEDAPVDPTDVIGAFFADF